MNSSFVGEGAALLAAFLWAAATLMFGRLGKSISPLVLNIVKGLFAIAMMIVTLAFTSLLSSGSAAMPALPTQAVWLLIVSGAVGIGLGDTAYFSAINTLGARRALLLETLAPPMAAVMAWVFLSEQLAFGAIAGITITLTGVAWVISERVPGVTQHSTSAGVRVALLATFCQASGAVLSRAALAETTVSPLWSSFIRLFAGLVFMGVTVLVKPNYVESASDREARRQKDPMQWRAALLRLRSPKLLLAIAMASFFATYLGIWLQQIALKYAVTGIAQALLATSPLFVLPMAALLGDRINWRATVGALIALSGVWILLLGG
ncbi:MAG: DMT family transporter [Cyanobacteria bacterium J06634_6]